MKVLVKEKIAQAGIDILKEHFDVEVRTDMTDEELGDRINDYDAIIVRSASKIAADVLRNATGPRMIGRAGVGVDNINVKAATEKGIVVANAPGSNSLRWPNTPSGCSWLRSGRSRTPTLPCMPAYGRSPSSRAWRSATRSLASWAWARSGCWLLSARRGSAWRSSRTTPTCRWTVSGSWASTGRRPRTSSTRLPISSVCTCPSSPETMGLIGDTAFEKMKKGVRIINSARGGIVDEAALARALESGKVASAGLDVFSTEPVPDDFPLARFDNVIMTPHLGASTTEGQDRAGVIVAEQIVAGLTGGVVSYAVVFPRSPKRRWTRSDRSFPWPRFWASSCPPWPKARCPR